MFVRSVKITSSSGAVHEYVRIVAAVREDGKAKQKVVANLGRRDTLEAVLPLLNRFLQGDDSDRQLAEQLAEQGAVEAVDASTWGPMLVARALWQELGLWKILDGVGKRPRPIAEDDPHDDWVSRALVLVVNRLSQPASEHGMAGWLETDFVCDRLGRRYLPAWKRTRRVQVDFTQLTRWYRTLDRLILNKSEIEVALYRRLRDLFDFQPELVFYDLTSTYFEGRGPESAKHGYSRDGKKRNVQVVVGVVMVAGWPITHHVWAGNTRDLATVPEVLDDLRQRFAFRRVVFVGDRGMVSEKNFAALENRPPEGAETEAILGRSGAAPVPPAAANSADNDMSFGWLLGVVRRRNPEVEALLDRLDEQAWIDCPAGINAREKKAAPKTRVQEVKSDKPGVRIFVVDSDERREYEERMRQRSMERSRQTLLKLQQRVAAGRLKDPAKIGAAAERALRPHHGGRYWGWKLEDGRFEFFEHPVHLPREKRCEGKYLIQTDQADLQPVDAVAQYKQLADVERGFRTLKDPLALRPIHHRADHRVQAHIFVAALAFLLDRLLEQRLKSAKTDLSTTDAWLALKTIRHVTFQVNGEHRTGVTPGSPRARQILKALNLLDLRPPAPPSGPKTIM